MTILIQGKLEKEVMRIMWGKRDCSPKEVLTELDNNLALTTVSTILERLYAKGILNKIKVGSRVRYTTKVSQDTYSKKLVKQFINNMINSFGDRAVTYFAKGVEELPKEKREELSKLLREYENK